MTTTAMKTIKKKAKTMESQIENSVDAKAATTSAVAANGM